MVHFSRLADKRASRKAQNITSMFNVFVQRLVVNYDIIEVNYHKFTNKWMENFTHHHHQQQQPSLLFPSKLG
jgi:hypothetical protein